VVIQQEQQDLVQVQVISTNAAQEEVVHLLLAAAEVIHVALEDSVLAALHLEAGTDKNNNLN
jgi:hypothetical protein